MSTLIDPFDIRCPPRSGALLDDIILVTAESVSAMDHDTTATDRKATDGHDDEDEEEFTAFTECK